jgi:hypothetical protein
LRSQFTALDYPITSQPDGIKLKPEKMVTDKLYHCIFEEKVFLFYKDYDELLHCYEVQDPIVTKEISENPEAVEEILKKYCQSNQVE